jgi:hypothetical protein
MEKVNWRTVFRNILSLGLTPEDHKINRLFTVAVFSFRRKLKSVACPVASHFLFCSVSGSEIG